jgi:glycosyltransferase involved in cell wall biosynthesis
MQHLQEFESRQTGEIQKLLPVSVIVPARNEARNLPRCLESLRHFGEVYVVDSQSEDETAEIARQHGAKLVQFYYHGGWPKKRQWAMETLPLKYEWVLLLDADEVVSEALGTEILEAVEAGKCEGFYIAMEMHFLGRKLRHSGASFWKLSLFRRNKARFECRLKEQDNSMADMEVHEHVVATGRTAKLRNRLLHHNVESLAHYIRKHNEYSNWEARVWIEEAGGADELPAAFWGTQAQRRRWLKKYFLGVPGSPLIYFFYKYLLRLGFLDGVPGLIYCALQGVQLFHIKSKIYELRKA